MATPTTEKRWIVKEAEGKIWGPYSTEQILEQIERGYYVGGEQVATFPGGQWVPISKTPEFYDRLLDVLVQEGKQLKQEETVFIQAEVTDKFNIVPGGDLTTPSSKINQEPQSSTDIGRRTGASVTQLKTLTKTQVNTPVPQGTSKMPAPHSQVSQSKGADAIATPNLELTDLKTLEEKEAKSGAGSKLPMILIGLALVLVLLVLLIDDSPTKARGATSRVHLLQLKHAVNELPQASIEEKSKRALQAFQNDTFTSYQKAQNELVEAVEGSSNKPELAAKNAERIAFLCLTYRELWPYAYQDSQDLKTVSAAMQEAKRLDPGGKSGGTCEIVHLMLNGRLRDAQGLTDNLLVEETQTPVLFEMRGDLFSQVHDSQNADTYFQQARLLWPTWQKISVEEARAKQKTQHFAEAAELYQSVLEKVPTHPVAKIELGLLQASIFQHPDEGAALIKTALDGKEKIPDPVASNGYLGLAKIQESKNLPQKAGQYAKRAYELNAANLEAKMMAERLNGKVSAPGPKEAQGLIYLGDQYFQQGDYFSAQAQYKTAFEADPKSGISAMKAARCLWALNQSNDAIEWMKKAVAADPQLTSAYVYLAEYYARRYDFQAATQILSKAQHLQPNSYEVFRGLANVELIRNNFKGAAQYGQRALKLYESDLETYLIMAKANIGLNDYQAAERFSARAIELDYNNTEAQSLYGKSEAGLRGVDSGVLYMQSLIKRFVIAKGQQVPQAAIDYRVALGNIFMSDARYPAAEQVFQEAVTLDPNNKKALIGLAKAQQAQGKQQYALESFLRAAVLDPSDAEPIFMSGNLYAETGKIKDASKQYERVLKINAKYPRAHVALGQMYLRQGDGKNALEEAMKEREINPGLRDSFVLAAEAYFTMKQYSQCAAEYQQGSKGQRDSTLLVKMARCYRLAGSLDSAQSLLKQAQSIESGNPDVYKEQGAIYQTKGMADEAIAAYDTYLQLAPAASDRDEVERRKIRVRNGDLSTGE